MKKYNQGKTKYCGGYAGAIALEYKTGKKYDPVKIFKETDRLFEHSNGGGLYITNVMKYLEVKGYIKNISLIAPQKKWIEMYLKKGIVLVKLNKYRYRWNTFYRYNRTNKAHIMAVIDVDDTYVYTWNSWGDGRCKFKLKDFENTVIFLKGEINTKKKWKYFSEKETYKLEEKLVDMLDEARGIAGIPFKITSGYRTKEHNKKVGGKSNSEHLYGRAVDLRCKTSKDRYKIINALLSVGFNRIGIADNFIHCDIGKTKPQNVIWTY